MHITSVVLFFVLGYSSMEAEAVDRCKISITENYEAANLNLPSLTERLCGTGSQYWRAAVDGSGTSTPLGIEFGEIINNACTITGYKSDSNGDKVADWSSVVTDVIDYKYVKYLFSSSLTNLYVLPCSKNLLAVNRCVMAWEASGASYQIFAPYDLSEEEISAELEVCVAKMTLIDEDVKMYALDRPDFI